MADNESQAPKKARGQADSAKLNIFQRIVLFIRQVVAELKKVHWPSRKELVTFFWVVVIFVLILMVAIGIFDFVFAWLTSLVFG